MAEFALGSIATLAHTNPQIEAQSLVPYLGSRLSVHWNYIIPLLIGIGLVHLLLVIGAVFLEKSDARREKDVEMTPLTPSGGNDSNP